MDDGGGTYLPGSTEGTGTVQGLQGGYDGGIFGGTQDNTAWAINRGETDMENIGHRGRAADISHGLPGQGRPAELSGGEMPRTSGDEDGNVGPFSVPAYPVHCGHFGGGKPPPPTVPPMQHDCLLLYTEWKAHSHHTMSQGRGVK